MPSVVEMMKKKYCLGEKTRCARYQVSSAGMDVPMDLFPHEDERAKELLRSR